eukprot:m51a1_g4311 hypothetical protein (287) ;mRNA; f:41129-42254
MSTRTERIFAAFQGPVLSLDSPVVHMFKTYHMELLLPRRWRQTRSLSPADVFAALQSACVRAEASSLSPAVRCPQCGDVVEVADTWAFPGRLPDDLESFCATVRSKCTSSRRHLRAAALVLTVDIGGVTVCSGPFSVFAREPGRYKKRQRRCGSRDQQALSPSGGDSSTVASPIADPRVDVSLSSQLMLVVQILEPQPCSMSLPLSAFNMVDGIVRALGQLPGFLFQKSCVMGTNKLLVFVRAYTTAEDAVKGDIICYEYAKNIIPNEVNRDIIDVVSMLALCRSW